MHKLHKSLHRKRFRNLILLLLPLAVANVAMPSDWIWRNDSNQGLYRVTAQAESGKPPIGEMHRWIVNVSTKDGEAVYPAQISVGGGMRGHGHGLPTQPQVVAYGGNGDYLVDGMRFNMEGTWLLSFVIDSGSGNDRVDFEIQVEF